MHPICSFKPTSLEVRVGQTSQLNEKMVVMILVCYILYTGNYARNDGQPILKIVNCDDPLATYRYNYKVGNLH